MTFTGDVCRDLTTGAETHTRRLSLARVGLLGPCDSDLEADTLLLRALRVCEGRRDGVTGALASTDFLQLMVLLDAALEQTGSIGLEEEMPYVQDLVQCGLRRGSRREGSRYRGAGGSEWGWGDGRPPCQRRHEVSENCCRHGWMQWMLAMARKLPVDYLQPHSSIAIFFLAVAGTGLGVAAFSSTDHLIRPMYSVPGRCQTCSAQPDFLHVTCQETRCGI